MFKYPLSEAATSALLPALLIKWVVSLYGSLTATD